MPTLVSLGAVLLFAAGAFGASSPSIATLNADVWPEHDDPRILVIYRGTLGARVVLPATLTFVIPSTAQVNAAAYRGVDGQLLTTPHQDQQETARLLVSMTVPAREFQFEYYADAVTGEVPQRAFGIDLVFPLAIDNLRVAVEQPFRASAFALDPPPAQTTVTPDGFTHHVYSARAWPPGRIWRVSGRYRKDDREPSVSRAARAPAPTPGPAPGPVPSRGITEWWWAVAVVLAAAVCGGGILARNRWRNRHPAGAPRRGPKRRSPSAQAGGGATDPGRRQHAGARAHCPHCGASAKPKDRYCSRCGKGLVV